MAIFFIKGGGFTLKTLNSPFTVSGKCSFLGQKIVFDNNTLRDNNLNMAKLNGYLDFSPFPNYLYDISIEGTNFLALNTTRKDNEDFYGTVYVDGIINIIGDSFRSDYNIVAKTTGKSVFSIPILSSMGEINSNFIDFGNYNADSVANLKKKEKEIGSESNISFDLEITPDVLIQIVLDEVAGDIIKARGTGDFNIIYNSKNDVNIFGEYQIDNGDYLFTLRSIVNKKFDIEPGSTILWTGDPYKADINLNAIYRTKSSLSNLMRLVGDTTDRYKKRVPVECVIGLKNELMNPEIELNITVPTVNEANEIITSLSKEDKSMQFMFLLVFNNFFYDPNNPNNLELSGNSNALNVTTMELLSNQVSNWLSKINSEFNIGINYRPGNEITTDEVEVALSTQLLKDRVSVSVNGVTEFGVQGTNDAGEATKSTEIVGDVNIEVKLNKKGNLRLKGFSRSSNDPFDESNSSTQGLGFFYTKEFNSFADLVKKNKKANKENYRDSILQRKINSDTVINRQ
ncbi:MAG: translocation/assembly module TamB domain-containing protein [Bacteroidales bacterium]|nr:translocation/assembly module TamB domain-containing protein [Bacteroidales bacterium]